MADDREMRHSGRRDQLRGRVEELKGKVRGDLGDLTDNRSEHVKGRAQELKGKAQRKLGEVKESLGSRSRGDDPDVDSSARLGSDAGTDRPPRERSSPDYIDRGAGRDRDR